MNKLKQIIKRTRNMFVGVDQLFIVLLRIFLVITFIDKKTYPVSTLGTQAITCTITIIHVFYQ